MGTGDVFEVMKMFETWILVMVQLCKLTENHLVVPLKQVNFMACKLYCNEVVV